MTQVRNNPITVSNVVTYEVIIDVNNQEAKLKPGMTANVEIITAEKEDVFFGFQSGSALFLWKTKTAFQKRYQDKGLWVLRNGEPKRITIRTGVSDDDKTEISGEGLRSGEQVIIEKAGAGTESARAMRMRMPR